MELRSIIECLLFSSPRGLAPGDIKSIIKNTAENSDEAWIKKLAATRERAIEKEIKLLSSEYEELNRSFHLRCVNGKWQFHSNQEFNPWLQVLLGRRQRPPRLTQPSLETLSIIAYRQPITRAGIEKIRGVSVDGVMGKLMERGLVEEKGKSDLPGKPSLYATTELFLEYFGLGSLLDLPDSGMLKTINADPDTPLEAPPENLHKVSNPDELSEWGIENTLDLAPNEPPAEDESKNDIDDLEDEEFVEEEDEEDNSVEYASKLAVGLEDVSISATEEEIINQSNQSNDKESDGQTPQDQDSEHTIEGSGESDVEENLIVDEKSRLEKEHSLPLPFVLEAREPAIKLEDTETVSHSPENEADESEIDKGESASADEVKNVEEDDSRPDFCENDQESKEITAIDKVGDSRREILDEAQPKKQSEESEMPSPSHPELPAEKVSESEIKLTYGDDSVEIEVVSGIPDIKTSREEVSQAGERVSDEKLVPTEVDEPAPSASKTANTIWSKLKSALNSIEDPTNPVQFITLCSKQLWQTLNTIGKKLMSWIKK